MIYGKKGEKKIITSSYPIILISYPNVKSYYTFLCLLILKKYNKYIKLFIFFMHMLGHDS